MASAGCCRKAACSILSKSINLRMKIGSPKLGDNFSLFMTKLKSLSKKLRRLEASLQKDAKKLAKLQRKVEAALKTESAPVGVRVPVRVPEASPPARPAALPAKKKRALTPAGREKLSALMKARWAAKRAGKASSAASVGQPQNA